MDDGDILISEDENPHERRQIKNFNKELTTYLAMNAAYLDYDRMSIFYGLFFCIYYNNHYMVEVFRNFYQVIARPNDKATAQIDKLLEYIDQNGLECLRDESQQIHAVVFHLAFYQAIDDDLRAVYSIILRQSKRILMRDKDALHLMQRRDYDLIALTMDKKTQKLKLD